MKINSWLIVGAGGFLGSHLSKALLRQSRENKSVTAIDRARPAWLEDVPPASNLRFVEADWLEIPLAELDAKIAETQVWVICASVLPFRSRGFDHSANVRIAERVLDLYRRRALLRRPPFVIFVSSSSIYGFPADAPLNQFSSEIPVDDYGKSKLMAEQVYLKIPDGDCAIVRPRTILGKGRGGTVTALSNLSKRFLPIPVPRGNVLLQLCHVQDLVALIIHLGTLRIAGLWPAFSLFPKTLEDYVLNSRSLEGFRKRVVKIPLWSEPFFRLLVGIGVTAFTHWHVAGFFRSHVFDGAWLPPGFHPAYSCQEAFDDALS